MGKIGRRMINKEFFCRDDNSLDQSSGASGDERWSVEGFFSIYTFKTFIQPLKFVL